MSAVSNNAGRITDCAGEVANGGPCRLLKIRFNSLRPHSCLSRGWREVWERSQFSRRVLRAKGTSSRFFLRVSQHPAICAISLPEIRFNLRDGGESPD